MQEEINQLKKEVAELKSIIYKDNFSSSQIFRKDVTFLGKIGFYNNTPVAQQAAIASPSGGATVDGAARAAIDSIRTTLTNLGLTL